MELIQTLRATVSDDDDRGVSPVIGVILMVAITVILAAVIATFVLGLGESVSTSAPQVTVDWEEDPTGTGSPELTATHSGGDTVNADRLSASGGTSNTKTASGDVSAGTEIAKWSGIGPDTTASITWTAEGGDTSATLSEYEYQG